MKSLIVTVAALICGSVHGAEYLVHGRQSFFGPPEMKLVRTLPKSGVHVVTMSPRSVPMVRSQGLRIERNGTAAALPLAATSGLAAVPWHLRAVQADRAHAVPGGRGEGVTVCLVDSGVSQLADLQGVVSGGINLVNSADPLDYADDNGHGTALASLIAGGGASALGVAPAAKIFAAKVLDKNGIGEWAAIAEGIAHCRETSQVINLSLGSHVESKVIEAEIDKSVAAGLTVLAASGNDADEPSFPARYAPVISVGASTEHGTIANYSNFGADLDFVAPGSDVEVLDVKSGRVFTMSGTSMSCAVASGVEAVRRSSGGGALRARSLGYPADREGQGQLDAVLSMQP